MGILQYFVKIFTTLEIEYFKAIIMGWDLDRFTSESIDSSLICCICHEVLNAPVQAPCQHVFCSECINNWIQQSSGNQSCPVDRSKLLDENVNPKLQPIPFELMISLTELEITCTYTVNGCDFLTRLGDGIGTALLSHEYECPHNPKNFVECPRKECGLQICKLKINQHNCIEDLKVALNKMKEQAASTHKLLALKTSEKGEVERNNHMNLMLINQLENENASLHEHAASLEREKEHLILERNRILDGKRRLLTELDYEKKCTARQHEQIVSHHQVIRELRMQLEERTCPMLK